MVQENKRIGVIVVDDEAIIRMLVVDILTEAGFEVIGARNADEAISLLQDRADQFHVLFTDVQLPGLMDGRDLANHTKRHWPWMVIIVASGKARPLINELPVQSHFFQKPYNIYRVVDCIRKMA